MKAVGVLGGMTAVVWAMRDRFISIAVPREPEPPTFRVVTPPGPIPGAGAEDLSRAAGIGPVFAARLREAGIDTPADLAVADPAQVAELAGVPLLRAQTWIDQAAGRGS